MPKLDLEFTIDSNNAEAIARALEIIGLKAEGYAKQYLTDQGAVDTGNLRNSVTHQVDGENQTVEVGTAVEYAVYVELGTSRYPHPRPYIRPSIELYLDEYEDIIKSELKNG